MFSPAEAAANKINIEIITLFSTVLRSRKVLCNLKILWGECRGEGVPGVACRGLVTAGGWFRFGGAG